MAFGGFDQGDGPRPMSEINTTPLVDVMLVLLIIFMITAPLLTHAVKIDLPQAATESSPEQPETITLSVDGQNQMFWNADPIPEEQLLARLTQATARKPQPELHLRVDRNARYQRVAEILATARNAGVTRIGFVTDPSHAPEWTLPVMQEEEQ
jgi:biopolymer transport protein ExbD